MQPDFIRNMQAQLGALTRQLQNHQSVIANQQALIGQLQQAHEVLSKYSIEQNGGPAPMAKEWGGRSYVSIKDLRGRIIPYDLAVNIDVGSGETETLQQSAYITMEGPFVAVRRFMSIRSSVTFEATDANDQVASFLGRSSGHYRPISSHADIMDAVRAFEQVSQYQPSYVGAIYDGVNVRAVGNPAGVNASSVDLTNLLPNFPGTGRPLVVSPLSNASSRSMSFNGVVAVELAGANYARQSIPIPTQFWGKGFGDAVPLAECDVFEPGDSVVFKVTPNHPLNPAFGNIQSLVRRTTNFAFDPVTGAANGNPLPTGPYPFISGQFDGHEGINDETFDTDVATTPDRVTRATDALITIGYQGYKIVQAPQGVL